MTFNKICVVCGKEFTSTRSRALTCSEPCRRERNRQLNKDAYQKRACVSEEIKCEMCGRMFNPAALGKKSTVKFCSAVCWARAHGRTMTDLQNPYLKSVTRECGMCGRPFLAINGKGARRTYCSDACAQQAKRINARNGYEPSYKAPVRKRRVKGLPIEKVLEKAREEHLTYGEWVVKHELAPLTEIIVPEGLRRNGSIPRHNIS